MSKKTFDCVELKNIIQSKLLKEYQGMKIDKAIEYSWQKLQSSQSPVAKLWRQLQERRIFKKAS